MAVSCASLGYASGFLGVLCNRGTPSVRGVSGLPLILMPFVLFLAHIPSVLLGSNGAWDVLDLFLFLGNIIGLHATWEFSSPPSIEGVSFPPKYWEFFIKH